MHKSYKRTENAQHIIILAVGIFFLSGNAISFAAAQMQTVTGTQPLILAPQGLSAKEQADLERQYRYTFRDKNLILSPYASGEATGTSAGEISSEEQLEQEKLYRYFGVALNLYKEGRLDEAIEILRYIADRNPDDEYVKSYLDKMLNEKNIQKKRWQVTSENDAQMLKEQKIKNLLKEGTDYYKQKHFDKALLKFSDVLALDPNNAQAKKYLDGLKEYYLKEAKVEDIVESYEAKTTYKEDGTGISSLNEEEIGAPLAQEPAEQLLDKKEYELDKNVKQALSKQEDKIDLSAQKLLNKEENETSASAGEILVEKESEIEQSLEKMLDEKEMELVVMGKRMGSLLEQADLDLKVGSIIAQKKEEDRKRYLYTLGNGDIIQISVRDHPELSGTTVVRLNGEVLLPLVNDLVKIGNLTLDEATAKVKDVMKRYVKDPVVAIAITDYKSKVFYVVDENGATPYPITRTNLTLRDALFIADWGANRALGRVIVMKPDKLHPVVKKVDAFDIVYRGNLVDNMNIEDGDVIYVPLTIAAKVTQTVADTISPFAAVRQARDEWINLKGDRRSWADFFPIHYQKATNVFTGSATQAP